MRNSQTDGGAEIALLACSSSIRRLNHCGLPVRIPVGLLFLDKEIPDLHRVLYNSVLQLQAEVSIAKLHLPSLLRPQQLC